MPIFEIVLEIFTDLANIWIAMLQCSYGEFGCTQILFQEIYAKVRGFPVLTVISKTNYFPKILIW